MDDDVVELPKKRVDGVGRCVWDGKEFTIESTGEEARNQYRRRRRETDRDRDLSLLTSPYVFILCFFLI